MKPAEVTTGHYLLGNYRLIIPPYQRAYEWQLPRWVDLWRDISHAYLAALSDEEAGEQLFPRPHFLGSLIVEDKGSVAGGVATELSVVDGQQRLLTLFMLACAMRDHAAAESGIDIAPKNKLSTVSSDFGGEVERVSVQAANRIAFQAAIEGKFVTEIPDKHYREQLVQAYRFFRYQLWRGPKSIKERKFSELTPPTPKRGNSAPPKGSYEPWGAPSVGEVGIRLPLLHNVITTGLKLLEVKLDDSDEEASIIFETMNSKGTPLRQFDLLRNSIFVRLPTHRAAFHASHWEPVERLLRGVSYRSLRKDPQEQFFYEYLIAIGAQGVAYDNLHRTFIERVIDTIGYDSSAASEPAFEGQFAIPLAKAAAVYPLAVGQRRKVNEAGVDLALTDEECREIRTVMALSGGPAVPVVLNFLRHVLDDASVRVDLVPVLKDVQSYIIREMLSGAPLSPLRATFMQIAADLASSCSLETLRGSLRKHDWKKDEHVLQKCTESQLYAYGGANMFPILRGIERQLSGGGANQLPYGGGENEYSIEHVYPQGESPGVEWLADMAAWGEAADREAMDSRKHVLGNLTAVTNYDNRKNGRKRFETKRELIMASAPLKLHTTISDPQIAQWTASIIDDRSLKLAEHALAWWPRATQ